MNESDYDTCISCGMPMRTVEERGGADPGAAHCCHCAASDGSLKPYDEVLAGMTRFLVESQGVDGAAAGKMAAAMMAKLPAWQDRA